MPVRLYDIPPLQPRPPFPHFIPWTLSLLLCLSIAMTLSYTPQEDDTVVLDPDCKISLMKALIVWMSALILRMARYSWVFERTQVENADNEAYRQAATRIGQRCHEVLAVSLHTALRPEGGNAAGLQRDALARGDKALKTQADWQASEEGSRHSRLPVLSGDTAQALLERILQQGLAEIAPTLTQLPEDTPLRVLREIDSCIDKEQCEALWQDAWAASGIRQAVSYSEERGLAAVDRRLDDEARPTALLLVVAGRIAPEVVADSAESLALLLLADTRQQIPLPSLARLHRPELERETSSSDLPRTLLQALDWAPLDAQAIRHLWVAGCPAQRSGDFNQLLIDTSLLKEDHAALHDIDAFLGQPGVVAPWLAIAAASESIKAVAEPHLVLSGDQAQGQRLWCTSVSPSSA